MAAPAPVGTAVANGGRTNAISLTAPTGTTTGDRQAVVAAVATTLETVNAPGVGWLLEDELTMTGAGGDTTRLLFYVADPLNDPGNAGFSVGKSGTRLWRGCRFTYRGGPGWNLTSLALATSTTVGTSHAVPGQTTTVTNSVVLGGVVQDPGAATTGSVTPPAGWTELSDTTESATTPNEALVVAVAAIVQATPGSVTGSFTTTLSDDAMVWSIILPSDETGVDPAARTRGFLSILLGG